MRNSNAEPFVIFYNEDIATIQVHTPDIKILNKKTGVIYIAYHIKTFRNCTKCENIQIVSLLPNP